VTYDKPIIIQKVDEATEQCTNLFPKPLHAKVNKSGGSEYLGAGANQSKATLIFEVRYFKDLEDINYDRGSYRIIYRGRIFNIKDYDDYQESHRTIKLLGVSINGN
jgi:SPP1 family predicted phage head-tail adaptor